MVWALGALLLVFLSFLPAFGWKMESGTIDLPNTYDTKQFTHVNFRQTYDVPPLVFAVATTYGENPCSLRVKNVTKTGFDISQVEPPPEDGPHYPMTIHYFAIEPGDHRLPNGIRILAGTITTDVVQHGSNVPGPEGWETINLSPAFSTVPIVLGFIQTMNSEEGNPPEGPSIPWLTTAIDVSSNSSFNIALERSEVPEGTVKPETIGYVVIDSGLKSSFYDNDGNLIHFETIRTDPIFKGWGKCNKQTFSSIYSSVPNVVANKNSHYGGDGGWFRRCYLDETKVGFVVDEDRYKDRERNHIAERGGILVFSRDFDASFYTISGRVYEDVDGDGDVSDDGVALEGVRVILYRDNGDGTPGDGDVPVAQTTTDSSGLYSFVVENNFTYFVVVDSKTVSPSAGFNSNYGQGDVWAEQTYGGKGVYWDSDGDPSTAPEPRNSPGPAYGGRNPGRSDDASTLTTAEHVAKVEVNGSDVDGVDFGFSFNVVVNTGDQDDDSSENRTCQGCFRQFIQNANAIGGENHMRFVPAVPKNESSWWKITYSLGAMPEIVDDDTVVDGTAYCAWDNGANGCNSPSQERDENPGSEGTGGTVGVGTDGIAGTGDEPSLPTFERPELELDANDELYGLEIGDGTNNPSNVVIKRLAIYNTARDGIRVEGSSNNFLITENFIGFRADGSVPTADERIAWQGIKVVDDSLPDQGGAITRNYIGYCGRYNISVGLSKTTGNDSLKTRVLENEIVAGGCGSAYNYPDNISVYADDVTIENNLIRDACMGGGTSPKTAGKGIEIRYGAQNVVVRNNTIINNASAGVYYDDASHDGVVEFNLIHDNGKSYTTGGVVVSNSGGSIYRVKISKNSIYSNKGLSIDLDGDGGAGNGVTPNDGDFTNGKPNYYIDYPVFTKAEIARDNLHVEGYVGTSSSPIAKAFTLEIFKADDDGDNSGEVEAGDGKSLPHGEGRDYLGTCTTASDGTFACDITIPPSVSLSPGDYITGTAYLDDKGTSEMGANIQVVPSRASVSGYAFEDANHNSVRDAGEGALPSPIYVKACQGGSVISVVAPDSSTGYYEFRNLPDGNYTIVEATDNSTDSCTPSNPEGYISTTPDQVSVEVVAGQTARADFGDYHGSKVSGFVFNDKGDGSENSTSANNALFDSDEKGIGGVKVKLCTDEACSTVVDWTETSSDGSYALWAPSDYDGQTLYVVEEDPAGHLSTGDSRGSAVDSDASSPPSERNLLSYQAVSGQEERDYNFGDVEVLALSPRQSFIVSPGSSFTFSHSFKTGTPGVVSVELNSEEGWSYALYEDADCDGNPDSENPVSGTQLNSGNPLSAGQHCFIVRAFIPSNAPEGATDSLTITLKEDWLNTPAGDDDQTSVVDTITVSGGTSGILKLEKWVRNVSAGEEFTKVNAAKPCDVLEYRIDFKNIGTQVARSITIGDVIPRDTEFLTGQYNGGADDVEVEIDGEDFYGKVSDEPDADGVILSGDTLEVDLGRLTGGRFEELQPGQEGWLKYRVKLNCN